MSLRLLNLFIIFNVVLFCFTQKTLAGCSGLNFNLLTALIQMDLDPAPVELITVTRSDIGRCDFFIDIDNGSASSYVNRILSFGSNGNYPIQFYKDPGHSSILKWKGEGGASAADVIVGSFTGNNSSINHYYYPRVDLGLSLPNGSYSGGFKVTLYEGTFSNPIRSQSKNVNFKLTKSGYVNVSLVDTGAAYNINDVSQTLDFGNLVMGDVKGFDIVLEYNAGYSISMSSVNAGRIKNTDTSLTSANTIPYTLKLNGNTVALTNTMQIFSTSSSALEVSPIGGTRLPVSVTIGTVTGANPGTYVDTVAISVSSTN